jgi:alkylhydroperoxidase family enzyme
VAASAAYIAAEAVVVAVVAILSHASMTPAVAVDLVVAVAVLSGAALVGGLSKQADTSP